MSMKYRTAFPRRGRELARRSVYLHPQRRKYGSRHRKIVILLQTFAVPHPEFRLGGAACSERGRNHIPFGVYRIPKRGNTVHRAVGHRKVHTGGALAEMARSRRDKRRPFDDKKHGRHLARVLTSVFGKLGDKQERKSPAQSDSLSRTSADRHARADKGRTSLLPYMGGLLRQHMEPCGA